MTVNELIKQLSVLSEEGWGELPVKKFYTADDKSGWGGGVPVFEDVSRANLGDLNAPPTAKVVLW